jgi:hypothetical protein
LQETATLKGFPNDRRMVTLSPPFSHNIFSLFALIGSMSPLYLGIQQWMSLKKAYDATADVIISVEAEIQIT